MDVCINDFSGENDCLTDEELKRVIMMIIVFIIICIVDSYNSKSRYVK